MKEDRYVSPEMWESLERETRALAAALGIALPEDRFHPAIMRLVIANAVSRVTPLGKGEDGKAPREEG